VRGFNWSAIAALAAGAGIAFSGVGLPLLATLVGAPYFGALFTPLKVLYNYAWFVGFAVSFFAYFILTSKVEPVAETAH
jgi:cytosine/uracil/thiamine/allantoin permease